jgi:glycosyltransferase involved in cell wall biosynthesis
MAMFIRSIYFYPHAYLRDRQLDTIRNWPRKQVLNPWLSEERQGAQVTSTRSLAKTQNISWKQRVPLINLKLRPKGLPSDAVVYVWGGVLASGPFIVDLDNPYALTGYNISAMSLYRGLLKRFLQSSRCLEIRCLSQACKETLRILFGEAVAAKASIRYPKLPHFVDQASVKTGAECRFLFVGTQFEIKGGAALVRAFRRVYQAVPTVHLDLVTHLPPGFSHEIIDCSGITVHEARFSRQEIWDRFMRQADVLVHPTYVESFGMVVLEALAHGLAIIATDVYAIREMVNDGVNGALLKPPLSIWDGFQPSKYYSNLAIIKSSIAKTDTGQFEDDLKVAMLQLARDVATCDRFKGASRELFIAKFLASDH